VLSFVCRGIRRYTTNASFFQTIANIAKTLPETKVVVGGNAPVMVNCFRKQGLRVLLGAQMTEELRQKIGWDVEGTYYHFIKLVGSASLLFFMTRKLSFYIKIEMDFVILKGGGGFTYGGISNLME